MEDHRELLERFLNIPISSADGVFEIFAALPNARYEKGEKPMQRFVYVPGTRKDRVLLVAHADTFWDQNYVAAVEQKVIYEDGIFRSGRPDVGIGADDRAGCAMLWALRNSGHSLLITDGEEHGKHGANYLRREHRRLFRELNRHRHMIQLDWACTNVCLYNNVDTTKKYEEHVESVMGFRDHKVKGNCDLMVLSRGVCGVNLGIGYHRIHGANEHLSVSEWENTYKAVSDYLEKPQKRFPTSLKKRTKKAWVWLKKLPRRAAGKIKRVILAKLQKRPG